MKIRLASFAGISLTVLGLTAPASVLYVDLNNNNPASPYAGWNTAATNIQDAIDASSDGDQIWVTNGIYQTGGRVMAGDLTNRVALTKAVTVQSVSGPFLTIIQGAGATSGLAAVRCAWLTNNAVLSGFTLRWGATRAMGDTYTLQSGGGVWCASSNAFVIGCIIASNSAWYFGGGAYQGTLKNSLICSNGVRLGNGGGACNATLNSCTVVSNGAVGVYMTGPVPVRATNCIIYFNASGNYLGGGNQFAYCCITPTASGPGNFTNAPQLFVDGVRLLSGSPCIGAGLNQATSTDLFGKARANPPSVGCAEYDPLPLIASPQLQLTSDPVGFTANAVASAQSPFLCWWLKDGVPMQDNGHFSSTQTTNLVATGVVFADAGSYQLVVSNISGVVTSTVAQLVIHCVDVAGANPVVPFTNWMTAATNIQDAIAAATAGDVVLVTNGLYATGGKSMDGLITNRVSVDKAILVQSVNGPVSTIIQGAWDPVSTNGPSAVRCVWLTTNAVLGGFTLRDGATSSGGSGGGVYVLSADKSPNASVANCVIIGNSAGSAGGGAYRARLNQCVIATNCAVGGGGAGSCTLRNCAVRANVSTGTGGGVLESTLQNCAVTGNTTINTGGGAYFSTLVNCTVTGNQANSAASGSGGGVANCSLSNCIVVANSAIFSSSTSNSYSSTFSYSCTPGVGGGGNIVADPLLLGDGVHLSAASPCIGAGANVAMFTDIDGQPWNNPPAIGCDEWQPAPVVGAGPSYQVGFPAYGITFNAIVAGQSPFYYFWSRNGVPIQDDGHYSNSGTASLVVNHFGPDDAGLYQVVVSNSFGVVTSQVAQVVIHAVDAAGANPVPPYSTWATAATTIQDAIDIAAAGDIVLATNGVYASGGKVMAGDLTNRVALTKAVIVTSVNGYSATVIQGAWDPVSTNGPGAVRCAWLTNGAVLSGFTLQNGATRATGDFYTGGPLESGGGVWCPSSNGWVANCLLTNNSAIYGGGIANGTLNNSLAVRNMAVYGGGAYAATLNNCTILLNGALSPIFDSYSHYGAGTYNCWVRNSIVLYNAGAWPYLLWTDNYYYDLTYPYSLKYFYSCTYPLISGTGNIDGNSSNPQFLDSYHIAATSPCCGTGSALYASGTDLDGEPWANPPSMGCDEVVVSNLVGPLSVSLRASQANVLVNRNAFFSGTITGRATCVAWSFGDGPTFTNFGAGAWHQWTNAGNYTVTFTTYNNDNPSGVSTNIVFPVQPLNPPQLQSFMLLTNGFRFQFAGQWSADYTVQYATNLTPPVTWQTLQTVYYNTEDVLQIIDPAWTNLARFYRVLAQ